MDVIGSYMKPDIIIKSFNRAFYLDRCLLSITKFVSGYGAIIVLDDGTPDKYLNKISMLYPQVQIIKSENHVDKSRKIEQNLSVDGYIIPSKLWIDTVKNASDYVLVIEDDVWFTSNIDLEVVCLEMQKNKVQLSKLGWQGNTRFLYNFQEQILSPHLVSQYSNSLFTANARVMKWMMSNKYKFYSILCRLGVVNNQTINEYYNYLSILMGLYHKNFWLYTWKDSFGRVNERGLLANAVSYVHERKKERNLIARLKTEVLKTTYISSATNSYHKYNVDFDVLKFNKIINDYWYLDKFDSMKDYPQDFSREYFIQFIEDFQDKFNFIKWSDEFMAEFKCADAQVL